MFDANRSSFTVYFFVFIFVLHLPKVKISLTKHLARSLA